MAEGSSKRVADLIDRLEVKIEAEMVAPEYLNGLQQQLNAMTAPADGQDSKYFQYALELQALIYGQQGKDEESMKCLVAAIEQAGTPKKLRSRLLKTFVRKNPAITDESESETQGGPNYLNAPPLPSGPGDMKLLSEREQVFMRKRRLQGTPEIDFLVRKKGTLLAMIILSGGMYQTYWFYKNWQAIRDDTGRRLSPFWRTFFYIFYFWPLFKTMTLLAKSRGYKTKLSGGLLASLYLAVLVADLTVIMVSGSRLLAITAFIATYFVYAGILLLVQKAASFAIAKQPKSKLRLRPVNYVEYIFIIVGAIVVFGVDGHRLFVPGPQPYHSGWQQMRINNAKANMDITNSDYQSCSTYLKEHVSMANSPDKATAKKYKDDVEMCNEILLHHDEAAQKYDTLVHNR